MMYRHWKNCWHSRWYSCNVLDVSLTNHSDPLNPCCAAALPGNIGTLEGPAATV